MSANTAIYQSSSAGVFLLSIPLLRERVTVVKVVSVGLTIVGVVLVSLFSSHEVNGNSNSNTTGMVFSQGLEGEEFRVDLETDLGSENEEPRSTPMGYVVCDRKIC